MEKARISVKMQKEWYGSRIDCVFLTSKIDPGTNSQRSS
jgi:hypothetical protein